MAFPFNILVPPPPPAPRGPESGPDNQEEIADLLRRNVDRARWAAKMYAIGFWGMVALNIAQAIYRL